MRRNTGTSDKVLRKFDLIMLLIVSLGMRAFFCQTCFSTPFFLDPYPFGDLPQSSSALVDRPTLFGGRFDFYVS